MRRHVDQWALLCASISAFGVVAAALVMAGPLDPPAGPVGSTLKTLAEVEPRIAINATNTPGDADSLFKITQPGSYYLTGNITGVAGKHGIEIAASYVSIDLRGFHIDGAGVGLTGIRGEIIAEGISIQRGTLTNWTDDGVFTGLASRTQFSSLVIRDCGDDGIVTGSTSILREVTASNCIGTGILAGDTNVIDACTSIDCDGDGISVGVNSVVKSCSVAASGANGISGSQLIVIQCTVNYSALTGISAGAVSLVEGCSLQLNRGDGVRVSSRSVVRHNACGINGYATDDGANIHATGADNRIEGNNCTGADRGIDVDAAGNIIIQNTCSGNTTNWDIVANNVFGPIIDRTQPASPAVNGNAAADTTGSTHPNANFTY